MASHPPPALIHRDSSYDLNPSRRAPVTDVDNGTPTTPTLPSVTLTSAPLSPRTTFTDVINLETTNTDPTADDDDSETEQMGNQILRSASITLDDDDEEDEEEEIEEEEEGSSTPLKRREILARLGLKSSNSISSFSTLGGKIRVDNGAGTDAAEGESDVGFNRRGFANGSSSNGAGGKVRRRRYSMGSLRRAPVGGEETSDYEKVENIISVIKL